MNGPLTAANVPPVISLHVRAYDLGVPHLHAETTVQIYTQETTERSVYFIIPAGTLELQDQDTKRMEALLTLVAGAPTTINNIQTFRSDTADDASTAKYHTFNFFCWARTRVAISLLS